jgi:hypothetical protein
VAALALAVGIGAAVAFVTRGDSKEVGTFAPLDPGGSTTWAPDVKSPLFYRSISPAFGKGKTSYVLRFRPNSQFRFGFSVHNRGRHPVRIEGIETKQDTYIGALGVTRLQMQHRPNTYSFAGATSRPLTIPSDGYGYLIATIETGDRCNLVDGGAEIMGSVRLEYSYRGVHRTQGYSLPMVIGIVCRNPQQVVAQMFGP